MANGALTHKYAASMLDDFVDNVLAGSEIGLITDANFTGSSNLTASDVTEADFTGYARAEAVYNDVSETADGGVQVVLQSASWNYTSGDSQTITGWAIFAGISNIELVAAASIDAVELNNDLSQVTVLPVIKIPKIDQN